MTSHHTSPSSDDGDLYCKLFVDNASSSEDFVTWIADRLRGERRGRRRISDGVLDLRVVPNDESAPAGTHPGDAFLYFPLMVESNPCAGTMRDSYVSRLAELIGAMREAGFDVVPACDFEDALA